MKWITSVVAITASPTFAYRRKTALLADGYAYTENEIAQGAMKSELYLDEICCADEIKSVQLPTKLDFITGSFCPALAGFIPSARTDFAEKKTTFVR